MKILYFILYVIIVCHNNNCSADEIIQDKSGNYLLIKDDGTFVKLPPPKPGNKYVIKKKMIKKKIEKKKIFKKSEKKARKRTNQGFR